MSIDWIIVDGYNSIHKVPELLTALERDLYLARRGLVRMLEKAVPRLAERITVVFDGRGRSLERDEMEGSSVEVIFSPSACSADTVIERMVAEAPDSLRILVVTSDHLESNAVSASGASTQSCEVFFRNLRESDARHGRRPRQRSRPSKFGRLGDHFPD